LIMALICIISWGVMPVLRFAHYLASSPRLNRTRQRALAVSLGGLTLILFFLAVVPLPNRFRAPGILEAERYVRVVNEAPGYVTTVLVPSGVDVAAGTPLVELYDKELELEITAVKAQRRETLALQSQALSSQTADLKPLRKRLTSIEKKLSNLEERQQALLIRARESGTWVAPKLRQMEGHWIIRGSEMGTIVNSRTFQFSAVVAQSEASHLFDGDIGDAEVRLYGQADIPLKVHKYQFIPFEHKQLPSAALGWSSGGDVAVDVTDESGLKAAEPFFQIYADLDGNESVALLHGRSGKIRFNLPSEPLLLQWSRKFRQLIQKRYRV
jgi:putative peptide zinc metalloprotease protein